MAKFQITVEVDPQYDSVESFIEDLDLAKESVETVLVSFAGTIYYVGIEDWVCIGSD